MHVNSKGAPATPYQFLDRTQKSRNLNAESSFEVNSSSSQVNTIKLIACHVNEEFHIFNVYRIFATYIAHEWATGMRRRKRPTSFLAQILTGAVTLLFELFYIPIMKTRVPQHQESIIHLRSTTAVLLYVPR